jgi:two-component system, chemotaxis family, chemotaxis protein CheY
MQPNIAGLSVLVVDDIREMRAIIRGLLHTLGVEKVLEASNGKAALGIIFSSQPDLIITDLSMQPMDGIELTRRLRQPGSGLSPSVPILVISAHTEVSYVEQALAEGVTDFLAKPITRAALKRKLETITQRPRPVVQAPSYHGPDRRRRALTGRKRRRKSDSEEHTFL